MTILLEFVSAISTSEDVLYDGKDDEGKDVGKHKYLSRFTTAMTSLLFVLNTISFVALKFKSFEQMTGFSNRWQFHRNTKHRGRWWTDLVEHLINVLGYAAIILAVRTSLYTGTEDQTDEKVKLAYQKGISYYLHDFLFD